MFFALPWFRFACLLQFSIHNLVLHGCDGSVETKMMMLEVALATYIKIMAMRYLQEVVENVNFSLLLNNIYYVLVFCHCHIKWNFWKRIPHYFIIYSYGMEIIPIGVKQICNWHNICLWEFLMICCIRFGFFIHFYCWGLNFKPDMLLKHNCFVLILDGKAIGVKLITINFTV